MIDFNDIRHFAQILKSRYSARDAMLEEMRRMFHMEWSEKPNADWIKATMSPSAFNAIIGAKRLLTTIDPQFSIPFDEAETGARDVSDKIEKAVKRMWSGSGRVAQMPVHHEMMLSALYAGEICGSVIRTADRLRYIQDQKNQSLGTIRRWKSISEETPYLFRVFDPATCYAEFDGFGMSAMLRTTSTTWGEVYDAWGTAAEKANPGVHNRWDEVVVNDYYDWDGRCYFLEGSSEPVFSGDHELPFVPVISQIAEGTFLFDKPELQRFPLLYGVLKSGMWKRENLGLTVLFSQIFALGSSPMLIHVTDTPGESLKITRDGPLSMLEISPRESITAMGEKVVDPTVLQALQIAQESTERSSISRAALGQAHNQTQVYSTLNLFSQQGRLPLVSPKELGGAAISAMVVMALKWQRETGESLKYAWNGRKYELMPDSLPDDLVINCNLEVDLPQDKLQLMNAAQLAVASRMASRRWAREQLIGIGQSDSMEKEMWGEQRMDFEISRQLKKIEAGDQIAIQQLAAQAQAMLQQQMQQQQQEQSGATVQGGPAQEQQAQQQAGQQQAAEMGQSMGETGAYPPGGQVGPGAPMQGPVPPRGQP